MRRLLFQGPDLPRLSIMNNIAEGFERQTKKEFKQFLFIAKGSCAEVRSMLHLGDDLMYISPNQYKPLHDSSIEIASTFWSHKTL